MRYGLIGEKLGHSFSKVIHEELCSYTYDLIPMPKEAVGPFLEAKEFAAINVTIPYKRDVMAYCDVLDPMAEAIGSVNTLVRRADGTVETIRTGEVSVRGLYGYVE